MADRRDRRKEAPEGEKVSQPDRRLPLLPAGWSFRSRFTCCAARRCPDGRRIGWSARSLADSQLDEHRRALAELVGLSPAAGCRTRRACRFEVAGGTRRGCAASWSESVRRSNGSSAAETVPMDESFVSLLLAPRCQSISRRRQGVDLSRPLAPFSRRHRHRCGWRCRLRLRPGAQLIQETPATTAILASVFSGVTHWCACWRQNSREDAKKTATVRRALASPAKIGPVRSTTDQ